MLSCLQEISRDMRREVSQQQYVGMIARFSEEFDHQLHAFMEALEADADIQYHRYVPRVSCYPQSFTARANLGSLTLPPCPVAPAPFASRLLVFGTQPLVQPAHAVGLQRFRVCALAAAATSAGPMK